MFYYTCYTSKTLTLSPIMPIKHHECFVLVIKFVYIQHGYSQLLLFELLRFGILVGPNAFTMSFNVIM